MQSDDLDSIIDRALSKYSDVDPLAGLEERVLNRIRGIQPARAGLSGRRWVLVLSMLTVLFVIATSVRTQRSSAPDAGPVAVFRTAPALPVLPSRAVQENRTNTRTKHKRAFKSLPKQEQFPAPAPITREERILLSFVRRDPTEAARVFADLDKRSNTAIEIEPLQLKPLLDDVSH